ncbi:acyltransferase family protein [Massilia suwonensis]|uniref:Acyltransferase family protein n=1 Tax=Massilia suwonensis TaxID=648895 RepID=A0ABW0MQM7_9BURK
MNSEVAQHKPGTRAPSVPLLTRSPYYFPEIDGIRAIAVLLVMFCHARFSGFTGGFIGVDLFFVISGYVVTLAITRQQEAGAFSLADFYARRMRRLLPSLYLVALATLVFCLLFVFPEHTFKLIKNLGFLVLFSSNVYLSRTTGYFGVDSAKQPLLHTWSLSVEEQFYFILPLCLVLLARVKPRTRLLALSAALLLALAYSIVHTNKVGAAGYYMLPGRLFEFLCGVVLALGIGRLAVLGPRIANLLVVLGMAGVAVCTLRYGAETVMPGTGAILPCIAAVLLIAGGRYAGALHPVLTNRPLRYLGRISYPLYLWHWPLIFAFNRLGWNGSAGMGLALAVSVVLAALTHRWIEQPWRARSERPRRTWLRLWLLPFLFMLGLYFLARETDQLTRFYPAQYRADYVNASQSVFEHPRAERCWNKVELFPAACSLGTQGAATKAVLWGDSHAYHQIDFLDAIGKSKNLAIHDMTFAMCGPVANSPERAGDGRYQRHAEECRAHSAAVMRHILADPAIEFVFMAAMWDIYGGGVDGVGPGQHGYLPGQFDTELAATIAQLQAAGKRVIMLDDTPLLPRELDSCASDRLYLPGMAGRDCSYSRSIADEKHQATAQILARVVQAHPDVAMINTYDVLCDDKRCQSEIDGVPLYKHDDLNHLGAGGSRMFYALYMRNHPGQLDRILERQ